MAKSSINFKRVGIHSFKHNDRSEIRRAKTVYTQYSHLNECDVASEIAKEQFDSFYIKAVGKVYGRIRKAKKENTRIEAVLNIKTNTTMADLITLQKHIEKKFGFTGLQIAIHKDEGHYENDKFIVNNHAHMSFFTLDRDTGRQMFRREHIGIEQLRELQTDTARILNMDRGQDVRESKKQRLEHREYKAYKREEELQKAKLKDLKEEVSLLRSELKNIGAKREDYAKLEALNKELKEEVKNKQLTIDDLRHRVNLLHSTIDVQDKKISILKDTTIELEEKNSSLESKVKTTVALYNEQCKENEILKKENTYLKAFVNAVRKLLNEPSSTLKVLYATVKNYVQGSVVKEPKTESDIENMTHQTRMAYIKKETEQMMQDMGQKVSKKTNKIR